MTVSYTGQVATCSGFGCFLKLLTKWRGSIYKLVWLDLTTFLIIYYVLNIMYRFALNPHQKEIFEAIVKYCHTNSSLIPLSFVLGFYVSVVMTRWWNQYTSIPWPDSIAVFVSATVHGQDERGRLMRRTIMRYVCLCITMVLGNLSPRVKKRFPTLNHHVESGLLIENEKEIIEDLNVKYPKHSKHWLPIVWAASIITRARKEGRIRDDFAVKTIIDELNKFRGQCGVLIAYDTISIPLVYTQVVTIAVYSFFLVGVVGDQWIDQGPNNDVKFTHKIDIYFPIFSLLQFFFYMGWLKVAEQLINPFGEDDDDFEVNWMVDRNLQVSYLIVDEMHHDHPELLKDQYWDTIVTELPHTLASMNNREEPPVPSTDRIEVSEKKAEIVNAMPSSVKIDEMVGKSYEFPENKDIDSDKDQEDNASGIHFSASGRRRNQSGSSTASMQSIAGQITRVNTVTSLLKRFLSKEDSSRPSSATKDNPETGARLGTSASSASISGGKYPTQIGSMKISDQVIEEVDEQMTITSLRNRDDPRPTAQSLFGQSPPTDPITIPNATPAYNRFVSEPVENLTEETSFFPPGGVEDLLSTSAPASKMPTTSSAAVGLTKDPQFGSQDSGEMAEEELDSTQFPPDDFERLRQEREQAKIARQKEKLARSISTQQGLVQQIEMQEILTEALTKPQSTSGTSSPTAEAS